MHKTFLLFSIVLAGVASGVGGATYVGAQVTPQIQARLVTFSLPADSLPQIRARLMDGGIDVIARDSDGKDMGIGKLTIIDNQIDPANGRIHFKASFDNSNESLRPGQFVNVGVLGYRTIGEVVR